MPTDNKKLVEERSVTKESGGEGRYFTLKATQIVWLVFGILEGLIGIRIILKLIAANPATPIVKFIYALTAFFLWPFQGITISPSLGSVVLEISSIIALIIYALVAWAIERIIWVLFYRPHQIIQEITETTTHDDRIPR